MKNLIPILFILLCANVTFAQDTTDKAIEDAYFSNVPKDCYWQVIEVEAEGVTGINKYLKENRGHQPIKPIKAFKKDGKTFFVYLVRYEVCK